MDNSFPPKVAIEYKDTQLLYKDWWDLYLCIYYAMENEKGEKELVFRTSNELKPALEFSDRYHEKKHDIYSHSSRVVPL